MNWDLFFIIIFYGLILTIFFLYRSKFEVQNKIFVLYKTKLGIKLMDKWAKKFPRALRILGYMGVVVGFLGMFFIFYILFKGAINLLISPVAQPVLAPVLPGVKIAGLPTLSFWYWIISIFIVALVHEFSHGLLSRVNKIKVKSSGFAFLGPLLAAFVEPDEKQVEKQKNKNQLSIFAAGPFSNILLAIVFLLISIFIISPIASSIIEPSGIIIVALEEDKPAELVGMQAGELIEEINNIKINSLENFTSIIDKTKPNDEINIKTNVSSYNITTIENPQNESKSFLGITLSQNTIIKNGIEENHRYLIPLFFWVSKLIFWLYVINLGVGLFNLLPLGPVDGGRMFRTGISYFIKNKKKVNRIWNYVTFFCLFLIFINLLPYIIKLILFILKPFFNF